MRTIKPSPCSGHIVVLSGHIKHMSKWIQPEYNVFTTLVTLETKTQFISEAAVTSYTVSYYLHHAEATRAGCSWIT